MPVTKSNCEAAIAEAWDAYLEQTRDKRGESYQDIEPWAWRQLRYRLAVIKRRLRTLESG
jgi:tRNA 2-selenouridine synthase SelU